MSEETTFKEWAIVELMGHRRLGGLVSKANIAGAALLRIDIPSGCSGILTVHCPVCGDCKCKDQEPGVEPAECPLHSPTSTHEPGWTATQFYGPSAIYCITPTDEELVRQFAVRSQPAPVSRWELPGLRVTDDGEGGPF